MTDLFVITTYFNPCRYATRRANYDLFLRGIRDAGVPCLTVECAFGTEPFELAPALDVLQVHDSARRQLRISAQPEAHHAASQPIHPICNRK